MELTRFLLAWRTIRLRDREVIDALVDPAHGGAPPAPAGPSPELALALRTWPGGWYWSDEPGGRHLVLTRRLGPSPRERWLVHVALFLATLATTTWAGAVIAGALPDGAWAALFADAARRAAATLGPGLAFSLPLLGILLAHELGHYVTARRYDLDVSPPYFIPVPPVATWIGTMGAFIRLRTVLTDRRQLWDVAALGPIAGFVVALPVLVAGLLLSEPLPAESGWTGMVVRFGATVIPLGDSPITLALRTLARDSPAVLLHPVAFAGWVGMFVTMLNLVPLGQLDGGHLLYAVAPRWHRRAGLAVWATLMALGWRYWQGWLLWGLLVVVLSRGQLTHPPLLDAYRELDPPRRRAAWGLLLLFLLTFAPAPFRLEKAGNGERGMGNGERGKVPAPLRTDRCVLPSGHSCSRQRPTAVVVRGGCWRGTIRHSPFPFPLSPLPPPIAQVAAPHIFTQTSPNGSACPLNRHGPVAPPTTRPSKRFSQSASTDKTFLSASSCAVPTMAPGAGACCSASPTPRRNARPRRSSARPPKRISGSRCATCGNTICVICTGR
ncbi:MAG: site-2 protease family protein [Gemmatimonadales bacterium]